MFTPVQSALKESQWCKGTHQRARAAELVKHLQLAQYRHVRCGKAIAGKCSTKRSVLDSNLAVQSASSARMHVAPKSWLTHWPPTRHSQEQHDDQAHEDLWHPSHGSRIGLLRAVRNSRTMIRHTMAIRSRCSRALAFAVADTRRVCQAPGFSCFSLSCRWGVEHDFILSDKDMRIRAGALISSNLSV